MDASMLSKFFMGEAWFGAVIFFGALGLIALITVRLIRGRRPSRHPRSPST